MVATTISMVDFIIRAGINGVDRNPAPQQLPEWAVLFSPIVMKILATLALLGVVVHAAIGFWVVATDYIKCDRARKVATILMHVLITGSALVLGIMLWMV